MGIFNSNCDFNKYKVFYAVAECKSFSKATELLYISQPAISHAIKELEEQLNTKLFIRDNKSVVLTEDGEKLMYYIKNAFDNIITGERILKEKKDELTGIIRIGIYSHISQFMLPNIIKTFSNKNPQAKFFIYSSSNLEMLEKLRNKELDIVILQYPIFINKTNFKEEILCELENCFFASKENYLKYINNSSLTDFPIILPMRGYQDINNLEETFKKQNLILKNNFTCYTSELTIKLVKEGIGIAWGLKRCIIDDIKNKELFEVPVSFRIPTTKFSIAYDPNFLNKTTIEFINYLKENIKNQTQV